MSDLKEHFEEFEKNNTDIGKNPEYDERIRNIKHSPASHEYYKELISIKKEFGYLIKSDDLLQETIKELGKEVVGEQKTLKIIILTIGSKWVKNKNETSFHTLLNSNSGSGKDFILGKVIRILFEIADYEDYTRISSRALDYLHTSKEDEINGFSWNNKFLVLHDIDENILNSSTLKLFLTEGTKTAIVHDGKVKQRSVDGKPIVLMTSAYSDPNKEQLRRINIINLDESPEQTKAILRHQASEKSLKVNYDKLRSLFYGLNSYEVLIPYADKIAEKLSYQDVFMRTFFTKILDYIKASCTLNQNKRIKQNNKLIANIEDYNNAKFVIENLSTGINFKPLSLRRKQLIDSLNHEFKHEWFSIKELQRITGFSYSSAYEHISKFIEDGFLDSRSHTDDYTTKPINQYKIKEIQKIKLPDFKDFNDYEVKKDLSDLSDLSAIGNIGKNEVLDENKKNKKSLTEINNEIGEKLLHDSDKILDEKLNVEVENI